MTELNLVPNCTGIFSSGRPLKILGMREVCSLRLSVKLPVMVAWGNSLPVFSLTCSRAYCTSRRAFTTSRWCCRAYCTHSSRLYAYLFGMVSTCACTLCIPNHSVIKNVLMTPRIRFWLLRESILQQITTGFIKRFSGYLPELEFRLQK